MSFKLTTTFSNEEDAKAALSTLREVFGDALTIEVRDTDAKKAPGSGGDKGMAIVNYMEENPTASRKEIAEAIGCTVSRVGEVVRDLARRQEVAA